MSQLKVIKYKMYENVNKIYFFIRFFIVKYLNKLSTNIDKFYVILKIFLI